MKYNAKIHKRRPIRLKGYDYSQQGMYFATVCTHYNQCNLGKVIDDEMHSNKYGRIVENELLKSNGLRKEIYNWSIKEGLRTGKGT